MEEEKQAPPSAPPAGMLGALLSNPELLGRIAGMIGSMTPPETAGAKKESNAGAAEAVPTSSQASEAPASAIPDGLSAVLSDPAMLEKLPQIMAAMKPLLASMPAPKPEAPRPSTPESDRDCLLLALKPFLSHERCEAVDAIIRISKLGTVFRQLK